MPIGHNTHCTDLYCCICSMQYQWPPPFLHQDLGRWDGLMNVTITGTRIKIHLHFVWRIYLILIPVLVTYCKLPKLQVLHEHKDLDDKNPNLVHIFIQSKFSILSVRIEALFPGLWHCPTGRRHSYTASCLKGTKCKEDLNHCLLTRLAASQVSRWVNIYKHNRSC